MTSPSGRYARRWFVTGAAGGMGRAIVERALADGDAVVASMRTPDALADLQQRFGQALEVEILDVVAITRAFLPALRWQGGGHIVQLSSVGGQTVFPGASAYHAAKWGLEGFTESVAQEVIGFGIRVTLIEPGAIRTGFGRALQFASPLAAYHTGPVAELRRHAASLPTIAS